MHIQRFNLMPNFSKSIDKIIPPSVEDNAYGKLRKKIAAIRTIC
jgi:hypothetical protein